MPLSLTTHMAPKLGPHHGRKPYSEAVSEEISVPLESGWMRSATIRFSRTDSTRIVWPSAVIVSPRLGSRPSSLKT